MKINGDQEALLDRGGHPTLRELLAHLVFNPVNGVLRLGNTRMVLQRTSFLSHLREEIVRNYGREDAFALLIRLGFQAGVEDSRFVQASWPNIDPGDAFTAGTRLHTVSGITRVETVHNDFDFKKGKFSGEFLWHESAEASEHRKHYGDATEPVCWSLVGYASGYATHSLGKLIVYKETECKAMGHKHCRVVGKPADAWGENDPAVQLFRRQIMPRYLSEEIQSRAARPKPLPSKFDASARSRSGCPGARTRPDRSLRALKLPGHDFRTCRQRKKYRGQSYCKSCRPGRQVARMGIGPRYDACNVARAAFASCNTIGQETCRFIAGCRTS